MSVIDVNRSVNSEMLTRFIITECKLKVKDYFQGFEMSKYRFCGKSKQISGGLKTDVVNNYHQVHSSL